MCIVGAFFGDVSSAKGWRKKKHPKCSNYKKCLNFLCNRSDREGFIDWSRSIELDPIRFGRFFCHCTRFSKIGFIGWSKWIEFDPIRSNSIEFSYPGQLSGVGSRCNRFDRNCLKSNEFDPIREPLKHRRLPKLRSGSYLEAFWKPFGRILEAIGEYCDANGRHLEAIQIFIEFDPFWKPFGTILSAI